ncbi:hypothetical protein LRS06_16405 [Hymenobacter sp. J193]|uniref:hypothetical protein n=1 Tax=Hymenobacter sp. J193 TaxID=2898429 RepID=UPI00215072AC|nr:hypothetical protein [Hymenobacter sp. J193]MCR5889318.1 hypothetical protein [Hymenobacter sp. J193]
MKKLFLLILIFMCGAWAFHVMNYKLAEELKNPIYVTRFTKSRFMKFDNVNVVRIEYEYDGSNQYKLNDDLNGIDINSFRQIKGRSTVDVEYRDKNYLYTIHDGEEKYIVRHRNKVAASEPL